jgi:hypothetical protein
MVKQTSTQWTAIDCRNCKESLVAVSEPTVPAARNSHDGRAWVHHDGYDPDTLEIVQKDAGHVPIYRKTPVRL